MKFLALIFALFFVSTAPGTKSPWGIAIASSTTEAALATDPVAEKRLQKLSEERRSLVCQTQTTPPPIAKRPGHRRRRSSARSAAK